MAEKISVESLEGLTKKAKICAISSSLRTRLDENTRRDLENVFFEVALRGNLNEAYIIEMYGSVEAKKRLASLYLEKEKVLEAAKLVGENNIEDLKPIVYPVLEQFALKEATTPKGDNFWSDPISWGVKLLAQARGCSKKEARTIIAKKFEELGDFKEAIHQYESQLGDFKNAARLNLFLGDKRHAAINYGESKDYESEAKIWFEEGEYGHACEALLKLGKTEEVRRISKEKGLDDILAITWKDENKWVAKSIHERKAKRNAKTLKERVKAHSSSRYVDGTEFLELCLGKKRLAPKTKNAIREVLEENYREVISNEYYYSKCDDGGPPFPVDQKLIDSHRKKIRLLWQGTDRYDKLAEHEEDPEKKAEMYLKAGMIKEAKEYFNQASENYAARMQLNKAKKLSKRIEKLESQVKQK